MTVMAVAATGISVALLVAHASRALVRPLSRMRTGRADQRTWLAQAGVRWSPPQVAGGALAAAAATYALVVSLTAVPIVALVPAICAGMAPYATLGRRRHRRLRRVQDAWPDGLRELVAAVSAGMALAQALAALADSGPEPLREPFRRYRALAHAAGVLTALEVVKTDLADPTSDRVIEVLILAYQRGGRIVSDILQDLAESTTEDVRTAEAIVTSGLEQRINARAVFGLPWGVLLVLTARPGPFRDFYASAGGVVIVAVAALLSVAGIGIVGRLAAQPIEDRVLTGGGRS